MKALKHIGKILSIAIYAVCGVALLVFLVPATGFQAKSVATGSMRPAIPPGSLVIIHRVSHKQLNVGDVITYQKSPGSTVTITHRVIAKITKRGVPYLVTKGDANPVADTPIPGGAVVGKVVWHAPAIGWLSAGVKTPIGLILIIVVPGILIIVDEFGRLRRALAKNKLRPTIPSFEPSAGPIKPPPVQTASQPVERPVEVPSPGTKTQPRRRNLDGMARKVLVIAICCMASGISATRAQLTTNAVTIRGTNLSVLPAPTPTPAVGPTSADQCKNGGWATFKNPDGSAMFKNQGQCVAYVNSANPGKHITSSTTTVTVTNSSKQSATTGSVTGGGPSGHTSNANSASTGVNVTN
jgi:signal peptidase